MITMASLTKRYNGMTVFQDYSLVIPDGLSFLIGPNGVGKTTLFRCITGLTHYAGQITAPSPLVYYPERRDWTDDWDTCDVLQFISEVKGVPLSDRWKAHAALLEFDWRQTTRFSHLSKGNRYKCLLLGLLIAPSRVLLMDEPTDGFDLTTQAAFTALVKDLDIETIVIATHNATLLAAHPDATIIPLTKVDST